MNKFNSWMGEYQTGWREGRVSTTECGNQNGVSRNYILPPEHWEEGLWPGIRSGSSNSLPQYLADKRVQKHQGVHNLKSSWVACANLFFPFRESADDLALLAAFLRNSLKADIRTVDAIELEYAEDGDLHPAPLLGESGGARGTGQTSPDVAFLVNNGGGIVLTESKLTEHSFYSCSARAREGSTERPGNADPTRCLRVREVLANPATQCHQTAWGRKYWERLKDAVDEEAVIKLAACPAAHAGYQLFRQQALAEGYAMKYPLVISAVTYDGRNDDLVGCLTTTGVGDFPSGWGALFKGKARFDTWTHQAWVGWVRTHQTGRWSSWLDWIQLRYGYSEE